jgi:hypothetical protein
MTANWGWGWSGGGFEGEIGREGSLRGCREQGTGKGGAGGGRERMPPPMRDRAAHEWGTQDDFVGGPPAVPVDKSRYLF